MHGRWRTKPKRFFLRDRCGTGERGFLLTGDRRYLEPYEKSLLVIPSQLQRLATLTGAHRQGDRVKRSKRWLPETGFC